MRNVFYVRQLDILEIVFWFSFNVMSPCENNGNLSETKSIIYSQPFLKMRKLLLDMRKDFLIMGNFYLAEILSEPNSLTIVENKQKTDKQKTTQNEKLCADFEYFFSQNENQEFAVQLIRHQRDTNSNKIIAIGHQA